jgi:glycosyltransferase involved in cell wall biosynthesis
MPMEPIGDLGQGRHRSGVTTVSAVIATYNRAEFLPRAIGSALAQDYPTEVVVVDDGSTDRTPEVLEEYGDQIVHVRQPNRERGAARNTGVARASGDAIAFLDSDDEWLPSHVGGLVRAITPSPDLGIAYSRADYIDSSTGATFYVAPEHPVADEAFADLLHTNRLSLSATMVRRSVFEAVGGFSEDRALCAGGAEDWDLWIRMSAVSLIAHLPRSTARVYFHENSTVANTSQHERGIRLAGQRALTHPETSRRDLEATVWSGLAVSLGRLYLAAGEPRAAATRIWEVARSEPRILLDTRVWRTIANVARARLRSEALSS